MVIFFNFSPTSNHLHPLQVENCDSNSRLVVDEDDYGKFRIERVKTHYFFTISFVKCDWFPGCALEPRPPSHTQITSPGYIWLSVFYWERMDWQNYRRVDFMIGLLMIHMKPQSSNKKGECLDLTHTHSPGATSIHVVGLLGDEVKHFRSNISYDVPVMEFPQLVHTHWAHVSISYPKFASQSPSPSWSCPLSRHSNILGGRVAELVRAVSDTRLV